MAAYIVPDAKAGLLALLSCWIAIPGALADPRVVRPEFHTGAAYDFSERPIETTLHKYRRDSHDSYRTTGESITFHFPAVLYDFGVNQAGGPQWMLRLALDLNGLGPIRRELRDLEALPATEEKRRQYRTLRQRRIFLSIYSSLAARPSFAARIDRGRLRRVGDFCGLETYVDTTFDRSGRAKDNAQRASEPAPFPFSEAGVFLSPSRVQIGRGREDVAFAATCDPYVGNDKCSFDSYFETWSVSSQIEKSKLCEWRAEMEKTRAFLAAHTTKRTGPR